MLAPAAHRRRARPGPHRRARAPPLRVRAPPGVRRGAAAAAVARRPVLVAKSSRSRASRDRGKGARGLELDEDRFHSILGEAAEALEAVAQMAESFDQTRADVDAQLLEFRAETAGTVEQVQAMLSAAAREGHLTGFGQGVEQQNGGGSAADAAATSAQAVEAARDHRRREEGSGGDAARVRRSRRARPTPLESPPAADAACAISDTANFSDRTSGSSRLQNSHEAEIDSLREDC